MPSRPWLALEQQAPESAQGQSGDSGRAWSRLEYSTGRFAVIIVKMPTELWEAQIDQSGEPALGIGQLMGDKTPLPTHKLELLGVLVAWLQGGEIAVTHSAGDKKRVIGIGLASPQMSAGVFAAQDWIEDLYLPAALQKKAPQAHPVVAAGFQSDKERGLVAELAQTRFESSKTFRACEHF